MPKPKNAITIFQLLDKSNCRECGEKTCMAFAGAVFTGRRHLHECPKLDPKVVEAHSEAVQQAFDAEQNREEYLDQLKNQLKEIDLEAAARRTGGRFENGRLTIKVMGKDFSVTAAGTFSTDIHVNPWVAAPLLYYVLHGKGLSPADDWRSFRELEGGRERYPLFQKRCEEPIKQVADSYTDLFNDMVHIFSGRQVEQQFESDISVVLHPLPKVPLMVCYWLPEEGMQSSLNLFFDRTADQNLDIGSIFSIGAGLAQMFVRMAQRHGFALTL
ncbi:MAG: DUF3786 domain-containing protein [Desulfobacterales bacterium]|jgi:hypothetical protein|nr:DUF3786 domain-containing protein [Desulfobacterales bacterium]